MQIHLDVPDSILTERVTGRRLDPDTGDIYHLKFNPPPSPEVAKRLLVRSDDTEAKVKVRIKVWMIVIFLSFPPGQQRNQQPNEAKRTGPWSGMGGHCILFHHSLHSTLALTPDPQPSILSIFQHSTTPLQFNNKRIFTPTWGQPYTSSETSSEPSMETDNQHWSGVTRA